MRSAGVVPCLAAGWLVAVRRMGVGLAQVKRAGFPNTSKKPVSDWIAGRSHPAPGGP